jgi:ElaB/YqjD/DUF883 family membrane-anchored ribosome-binding protein
MNTPKANTHNPSRRGSGLQGLERPVKPSSDLSETSGMRARADIPSEATSEVRQRAAEATSKLSDVAQQAGEQAKQTASSLANEANQKAMGFLNQQVVSGADLVSHVADSAKCAADNLEDKAPQLAELVRDAAGRVEEFSHEVRSKTVDELLRNASEVTRRQPALVFGCASLAGFFLFRLLKAKPDTSSREPSAPSRLDEYHAA